MFSVGDKVRIKNHPDEAEGNITRRRIIPGDMFTPAEYRYYVKFTGKHADWPNEEEYSEDHLISLEETPTYTPPVCECGLKYSRHGGKHSTYCPLYRKFD
jgi:hypothetical protein